MIRHPVELRASAAQDVERITDRYLAEGGELLALRFIAAFERAIVRISRAPLTGTSRFAYELGIPELRALSLSRFPYIVFYVAAVDRVEVWRILHSRRDVPAAMTSDLNDP